MTIIPPPLQSKAGNLITPEQFEMRQPPSDNGDITAQFYYDICNILATKLQKSGISLVSDTALASRLALALTCYLQDVVADGGLWRSFINVHKEWYGRWLPFYPTNEEYIEHELNNEDVRFLVWYTLAMSSEQVRMLDPLSRDVKRIADFCYGMLDIVYDDAPVSEVWRDMHHLDLKDIEDREKIMDLSNWLFMYSYLLSPAYALTMTEILSDPTLKKDDFTQIQARIEESMSEDPTGPLALYLPEWLELLLQEDTRDIPASFGGHDTHPLTVLEVTDDEEKHAHYQKLTAATGGSEIAYFADYESLNHFFIEHMGWAKDQEHLAQLKDAHNFVLLVNPKKGMLLAKNVAGNISDPANPLYDHYHATRHAIDMLTVRGYSPCDLTLYCCRRGWLKDARFPAGMTAATDPAEAHALVADNFDFIARCYLQKYYRD